MSRFDDTKLVNTLDSNEINVPRKESSVSKLLLQRNVYPAINNTLLKLLYRPWKNVSKTTKTETVITAIKKM